MTGDEAHLARHRVTLAEAWEALTDPLRVEVEAYDVGDEARAAVIGATRAGRILRVVYTLRGGGYRIVTAHPPSGRQRRRYLAGGAGGTESQAQRPEGEEEPDA